MIIENEGWYMLLAVEHRDNGRLSSACDHVVKVGEKNVIRSPQQSNPSTDYT